MQMQSGRLRIAVFLYGPTRGGATRRGLTLAEGFASRGHEVDLVMARRDGPLSGRISRDREATLREFAGWRGRGPLLMLGQ